MNLVTTISTRFNDIKQRLIKIRRFGKDDIQESLQAAPHGIDSNPIKDMIAIYSPTTEKGETVIIGYINKKQLAAPGETRVYSTDLQGNVKAYAWFNKEGNIELNGNANNVVRYAPLNTGLQNMVTAENVEFAKIAAAINAIIPGLYVPTTITLNISSSKVNDVKCD